MQSTMRQTRKQVHASNLMSEAAATAVLNSAFLHIYQGRKKDNANSDIWDLSLTWIKCKEEIRHQLLSGTYQLSPVILYRSKDKGYFTRWSAKDAVVLKAIANVVSDDVIGSTHQKCFHLKDRGGLKGAIRDVGQALTHYRYVIRSDVANFYDSMDHNIVMMHCKQIIKDKRILSIIHQYLNRVEVLDAEHNLIEHGIAKGCPLSPLMGAIMLKSLDKMLPEGCFYARYMDDWVILTKTRHQCRRLVKKMHHVMQGLKFKLALDKTYIGKIQNEFDFLGYRFDHRGIIGLAKKTILNFIERLRVLYEQNASDLRIAQYVRRWISWCMAGLA